MKGQAMDLQAPGRGPEGQWMCLEGSKRVLESPGISLKALEMDVKVPGEEYRGPEKGTGGPCIQKWAWSKLARRLM